MRKLFTIAILLFALQGAAQYEFTKTAINIGGGTDTMGGYTISYTIGKILADTTTTTGGYEFTPGYHAPLDTLFIWNGITSSDWFMPTNWTPNGIPNGMHTDVIIPNGRPNSAVCSTPVTINDVLLENGSLLTLNADVNVTGVWSSRGTGTGTVIGHGTVVLSGPFGNKVYGASQFYKLTANTGTDSVRFQPFANVDVVKYLNLQSGEVQTNSGSLTLLSSDTVTAYLNDFSAGYTGSISGSITAQRHITGTGSMQHFVSSPVNNATVQDLLPGASGANNVFVTPHPTCDENALASGSNYGQVFEWSDNGPLTNGCYMSNWKVRSGGNLQNGMGFSTLMQSSNTYDVKGAPNTGNITISNLTNSDWSSVSLQGRIISSGWSLIGNPYPSVLDLNQVVSDQHISVEGFDAQVQIYHPSGAYSGTYNPELMGSGGTPVQLSPFQAFMIYNPYLNSAKSFTFQQQERSVGFNPAFYQQQQQSLLELTVEGANGKDRTRIRFNDSATVAFDKMYDATKFQSIAGVPTLYSVIPNSNRWIAINTFRDTDETSEIDVCFLPAANNSYTMQANNIQSFDPTTFVVLEDKQQNVFQDLRGNNSYSFQSTLNDLPNRFTVHFSPALKIKTTDATCKADGNILLTQSGFAHWSYTLKYNGTVVSSGIIDSANSANTNVPTGVYELTLTGDSGYTVLKNIHVSGAQGVNGSFVASANSVEENVSVDFTGFAANANSFLWNFGDGDTLVGNLNVSHIYATPGNYTVTLTVSNSSGCVSEYQQTIIVTPAVVSSLKDLLAEGISAWTSGGKVFIDFSLCKSSIRAVKIYNALGQLLSEDRRVNSTVYTKNLATTDGQFILVSIIDENRIRSVKLILT